MTDNQDSGVFVNQNGVFSSSSSSPPAKLSTPLTCDACENEAPGILQNNFSVSEMKSSVLDVLSSDGSQIRAGGMLVMSEITHSRH